MDRLSKNQKCPLDRFRLEPSLIFRLAGLKPDPWQEEVLSSNASQTCLLCSRQVGKTLTASAVALRTALLEAPALVLVLSPSERQSGEFMQKVKTFYNTLKKPRKVASTLKTVHEVKTESEVLDSAWAAMPEVAKESALQFHLKNGSRIIGLPAKLATVLGYSGVSLLVLDEASRVPDDLYRGVRPMLATSRGRLLALSTPFGKRGWFYEAWEKGGAAWKRHRIGADKCQRIPKAFLEEELIALGERWYRQEYFCSFEENMDSVFLRSDIDAACDNDLQPLDVQGVW